MKNLSITIYLLACAAGCQSLDLQESSPASFATVKPIFEQRCLACHQGDYLGSKIADFRTAKGMIEAGYVVPGEPDKSTLLNRIYLDKKQEGKMPAIGHSLSERQMNLIGEWILQGANWPEGETLQPAVFNYDLYLRRETLSQWEYD